MAESDLAGNLQSEYVFFHGERVARKDFPSNAVSYYFSDHLNTVSVITDSAGNTKSESDYYPWGGELHFVNNDSNRYKFTGKERDNESGLDYFGARYYGNAVGRFTAADPLLSSGELSNPQSWNRYAYALNNPLRVMDPTGLYDWDPAAGGNLSDEQLEAAAANTDADKSARQFAADALKFRQEFRAALALAQATATQQNEIQQSLSAIGTENDHNGVFVDNHQTGYGAATLLNDNDTFNLHFGNKVHGKELAVQIVHEGVHVEQGEAWIRSKEGFGLSDLSHYARESEAWKVSSYAAQALGMSHYGPHGGESELYVWNKGWKAADIENKAGQRRTKRR